MTYLPALAKQLRDGCKCPSKDCACSATRMAVKQASVGRWDIGECTIRAVVGTSCTDGSGGVPYGGLALAIPRMTNGEVTATVYTKRTRDQVRALRKGGAPIVMSGLYGVLQGTGYECDDDFLGGHAFFLGGFLDIPGPNKVVWGDPLADGRYDYRNGYVNIPQDIAWRCGEQRTGGLYDSPSITVMVLNDTEDVVREARSNAVVQAAPRLDARNLRRLTKGREYGTKRTLNGGPWVNDITGRKAEGWWELDAGGFVPGEALVRPR